MHYFDFNATTPLSPAAEAAWRQASSEHWHNPSSPYRAAARVRNLLEACREKMASLLRCEAENLVFTSGATEGNNSVINYFAAKAEPRAEMLLSPVEHPCVLESARAAFAGRMEFLPVNGEGVVEVSKLPALLKSRSVVLVSVMAANNETGVLQPWTEVQEVCRQHGVPFHCDASQWLGKLPARSLGECDFLTGSAHKFGGPKGTGFVKISETHNDFTSLRGGSQEAGRRSGTENYPAIAAMAAALEDTISKIETAQSVQGSLRDAFENGLAGALPEVRFIGREAPRLWNTTSILLPAGKNTRWVLQLDKLGFAVSTGSACATGKDSPSHVLAALGLSPEQINRVVRVSAGWETSEASWEALMDGFRQVWQNLKTPSTHSGETHVISI